MGRAGCNAPSNIRLDGSETSRKYSATLIISRTLARHSRRPHWIDIESLPEIAFNEGLGTCPATAKPSIAEADDNHVSWIEVAINDIDNDGFLKRALMPFLMEADAQALDCRWSLARKEFSRLVLGARVVVLRPIRSLEQRPILCPRKRSPILDFNLLHFQTWWKLTE
jgi:hypothetical protein